MVVQCKRKVLSLSLNTSSQQHKILAPPALLIVTHDDNRVTGEQMQHWQNRDAFNPFSDPVG